MSLNTKTGVDFKITIEEYAKIMQYSFGGYPKESLKDPSENIRLFAYKAISWSSEALLDGYIEIRKGAQTFFKECNQILGTKELTCFSKEQGKLLEINGVKIHQILALETLPFRVERKRH